MISFPIEVGVLGWASTIVFWVAVVVIVVGIIKALNRDNINKRL